jgi:hypothetical protein
MKLQRSSAILLVTTALSITFACGTRVCAQYLLETPDGHQTIGPAQMYQQPMQYQAAPGPSNGEPRRPGITGLPSGSQEPSTHPSQWTAAGPPMGGHVLGKPFYPFWEVPIATRIWLGVWLVLIGLVTVVLAGALQYLHRRDEIRLQGGQPINEDYREPRRAA